MDLRKLAEEVQALPVTDLLAGAVILYREGGESAAQKALIFAEQAVAKLQLEVLRKRTARTVGGRLL